MGDEARAYCSWAGKRLPHAWEWQYAAQGIDGRRYPWGQDWGAPGVNAPAPVTSNTYEGPSDVLNYPSGCSPFGVCDMVGNVWQYTDEYKDASTPSVPGRTRFALLKGGSAYVPNGGTLWYGMWKQTGHDVHQYSRWMLFDDSYDRAASIGFRCVVD